MSQPIHTKYTTRSTGIWETIRKWLVLVPNRSSGNPIVSLYRVPPPGAQPKAKQYKDPVTIPSGDIVQNSYFARDHRRNYPQTSSMDQTKIAGLLTLGSKEAPRIAKGVEGEGQLAVFEHGGVSLAETLKNGAMERVGEVVIAPGLGGVSNKKYVFAKDHGMYDDSYPVRMFDFK